jgi:hypothetical protein
MYIITSAKKNIRATSGLNNDVAFHNKLFGTDDCVITFQRDPTPEEIEAQKADAKARAEKEYEKDTLIQGKLRDIAIVDLKADGKLDSNGEVIKAVAG